MWWVIPQGPGEAERGYLVADDDDQVELTALFLTLERSAEVLAEFQRAEAAFAGERPGLAGRASEGLRELVNHLGPAGARAPRCWTESVRRALTGGPPEWERLRQIGRDRGRLVPEWEIFHGLHRLATGKTPRGRRDERPLTVESIESAMELEGGLGQSWSLHRYLEQARKRCGLGFVPGRPEEVAATLLRVDASRHLLKPGGFTVGIRPGPAAATHSIDETTMRDLAANLQEATSRRMSASAGLDLLRSGATNAGQRPLDAEVGQALRAGSAIVRERRARTAAEQGRARATELRNQRLASSSTALFAAGAATGLSLTVVGLASGARAQLTTTVGVVMATLSMAGNAIKEWQTNTEAMAAPLKAWAAEKVAELAHRSAEREIRGLHEGTTEVRSVWARASAAFQSAGSAALTRTSARSPSRSWPTSPAARPCRYRWTADGLPLGVQLVGAPGTEGRMLSLATQLESARPWFDREPPI
jgi:hypothetical protein